MLDITIPNHVLTISAKHSSLSHCYAICIRSKLSQPFTSVIQCATPIPTALCIGVCMSQPQCSATFHCSLKFLRYRAHFPLNLHTLSKLYHQENMYLICLAQIFARAGHIIHQVRHSQHPRHMHCSIAHSFPSIQSCSL